MSIRHGLLALLEREPMYGYQLRAEFDATTGSTWPLNVGQVYTTLARLERDGLVSPGEQDAEGRVRYAITDAGRDELQSWFATPVVSADRPRDELAIKLALAVTVPGVDVGAVIQRQRAATITAMQDLTRLKNVRGRRRPLLDARARVDALPARGGGPLARPLRVRPRPRGRDAATADQARATATAHDRSQPMSDHDACRHPALEIIDVSRIHGRGDAAVHALRGLHLTSCPASSSRSWGRPAPASPPCSTSPAGSTRRPPDGCACRARSSARCPRASWRRYAGARSATSSRTTT